MSQNLSVVVITKNQEWNIERILRSVMQYIPDSKEIVLVDSASTDRTIEIASNFSIRIIGLKPNQRLTAAAGRYAGYLNTNGEYVLFLDGDVELLEKWHEHAIEILDNNPDIGMVGGKYINVPKTGDKQPDLKRVEPPNFKDVFHSGGAAAVYRREVLDKTGSFSPHIYSDEEPALAVRIRNCGYRVVRLDYPSVLHYTDPPHKVSTIWARRGRNLWIGHGQNIRNFIGTAMLIPYLKERGHGIVPAIFLIVGFVLLLITILTGQLLWIGLFLVAFIALFTLLSIYKRSLYKAFYTLAKRFIILEGTVRGFLLEAAISPEDYHIDFEILK